VTRVAAIVEGKKHVARVGNTVLVAVGESEFTPVIGVVPIAIAGHPSVKGDGIDLLPCVEVVVGVLDLPPENGSRLYVRVMRFLDL